jgi:hypothetical protein
MALAATALVLIAFMISSPHIVMAIGVVLAVVFVCMIHRMAVLRYAVRRESELLRMRGCMVSSLPRRDFPLPDDQYLVITQTPHGHEHRTLISGPPEYDTATAIPPAYLPKQGDRGRSDRAWEDRPREMEEARID